MKNTRTSTKYSMTLGTTLIGFCMLMVTIGMFNGVINSDNITSIVSYMLATATALFGLNQTRVTLENIRAPKMGASPTNPVTPVETPQGMFVPEGEIQHG